VEISTNHKRSEVEETHWHGPLPATPAHDDVPIVHRCKEYIQGICTGADMHDVSKDGRALGDHSWGSPVNHIVGGELGEEEGCEGGGGYKNRNEEGHAWVMRSATAEVRWATLLQRRVDLIVFGIDESSSPSCSKFNDFVFHARMEAHLLYLCSAVACTQKGNVACRGRRGQYGHLCKYKRPIERSVSFS